VYNGRIEEIARLMNDLAQEGPEPGCADRGPTRDGERCGEIASHFAWDSLYEHEDGRQGRYVYLCQKHTTYEEVMLGGDLRGFDYWNEQVMELEHLLEQADNERKSLRQLVEERLQWAKKVASAHVAYAEQSAALDGPGDVEDLDRIYHETIRAALRQPQAT